MNWNELVTYMKNLAIHEIFTAGWIAQGPFHLQDSAHSVYLRWLVSDTTSKNGVSSAFANARQDKELNTAELESTLSDMANDAGEDPEQFLENFFRALAAYMTRTSPLDVEATRFFMPAANFDKVKPADLFVPTFLPLIDCVPQIDTGDHNAMVEYFRCDRITETRGKRARRPFRRDCSVWCVWSWRADCDCVQSKKWIRGTTFTLRGWPKTRDAQRRDYGGQSWGRVFHVAE